MIERSEWSETKFLLDRTILSVQDGINILSANKKSLILISFVLIAFLVTGCGYKNSDLLTIPYDKESSKRLYKEFKTGHKHRHFRIFITKIEAEEIELMEPLSMDDVNKFGNIRVPTNIIQLYRNYTTKYVKNTFIEYDIAYNFCMNINGLKDVSNLGPVYAELDKNNNIVSIMAVLYYKKLNDKPDKNGYRIPINYKYELPLYVKYYQEELKNVIGYAKGYILTGSKAQEKLSCLNTDPSLIFNLVLELSREYMDLDKISFMYPHVKFFDKEGYYRTFKMSNTANLLKIYLNKTEEAGHNELFYNNCPRSDYINCIAIFSGGSKEKHEYYGIFKDIIAYAAKKTQYDDDYIHYELDTKNNIASFTNKDGKGKTYKYKMSASSIQNLKEDIIKYEKNSIEEINFHFLDIKRIEKAFKEKEIPFDINRLKLINNINKTTGETIAKPDSKALKLINDILQSTPYIKRGVIQTKYKAK